MKLLFLETTPDAEFQNLRAQGYTGTLNDMQRQFLQSLGYTGAINDMVARYDGGGGPVIPETDPTLTSVDADGWQFVSTAPAASYSYDTDPSYVVVNSTGHNAAGESVALNRILIVSDRVRQPNSALPTTNKVSVTESVYAGETISGVVNNSTRPWPLPNHHWLTPPYQPIMDNIWTMKLAVSHWFGRNKKPVAGVEFIVRDGSGNEARQLVTELSVETYSATGLSVPYYEANIDVSGLDRSNTVLVPDVEFRPWVGPAVLMSSYTTSTQTTAIAPTRGAVRDSSFVYAYVAVGASGSGVASADPAVAQASPYSTINAALIGARAANPAINSLSGLDYCVIRLEEGNHQWQAAISPAPLVFRAACQIEAANPAAAATTVILDRSSFGENTRQSVPTFTTFRNVTLRKTANGNFQFIDNVDTVGPAHCMAFENCVFDSAGFTGDGNWFWRGTKWYINCTGDNFGQASSAVGWSGGITAGSSVGSRLKYYGYNPAASAINGVFNGWNIYSNDGGENTTGSVYTATNDYTLRGMAMVGNVIERHSNDDAATVRMNGDGNTNETFNLVMFGNSIVGGLKSNFCYTDAGGAVTNYHYASLKANLHQTSKSHKAGDFYAYDGANPTNPARVGNWSVRYGVDAVGDFVSWGSPNATHEGFAPLSWCGDRAPRYAVAGGATAGQLPISFVDDKSSRGVVKTGGGDYTPAVPSQLQDIPIEFAHYPVDLMGNTLSGSTFKPGAIQP